MTALAGLAFAQYRDPLRLCDSLLAAQGAARDAPAQWWQDADIAFGRRLAATLPEDTFDTGIIASASGRLVLVADIRLDNRSELLAMIESGAAAAKLSDADVAMRAFERWGLDALPRLVGDFALVLWDTQRRRLHLARDYLGTRPLFLHRGPQGVAFASTAQALTRIAGSRPNPLAALHFLADLPTPAGQSFYQGIERVEPGHVVSIDTVGSTDTAWWRPDLSEARFASIGDAVDEFRSLLDDSVRCRLRSADSRIATHLSSGLDSGGVTATAARLIAGHGEVDAYTAVPPPGYAAPQGRIDDEGPAAAALATLYPGTIRHHLVVAPPLSPLDRLDACFELYGRPMPNLANHVWLTAINDAVRRAGIGVLLTGAMGNLTMSHPGGEALADLVRRGRVGRAARHGLERLGSGEGWRQTIGAAVRPWRKRGPDPRGAALIAPGAPVGRRHLPRDSAGARMAALRRVDGGEFGKAVLAGWGIDVRDPTADRRVTEFCLRFPVEYFAAGGVARGFARQALADRLPAGTLAMMRRARQAGWWYLPMRERIDQVRDEIERIAACGEATDLLDIAEMRRLAADWPEVWPDDRTDIHYRMRLLPAIAAGHFLRRSAA